VAEPQKLSKTYRQGAKGARVSAAVLCWLLGIALTAEAQEPTYSADSLTATFEKGSHISLKGTEIFVRDVVAEARISKVIFKNSQGDKVICELGTSAQHDRQAVAGTELRVKGRVRGRGLLGNMTLDACTIAPIDESTATPSTVPQDPASADIDVISETGETLPPTSLPNLPPSIAKQFATPPSAPRATLVPDLLEKAPSVPAASNHPENSIKPASLSKGRVPYGFYALLVLSGAVASSILSRLLAPVMRGSRAPVHGNAPKVRQAALQALLLKSERKK